MLQYSHIGYLQLMSRMKETKIAFDGLIPEEIISARNILEKSGIEISHVTSNPSIAYKLQEYSHRKPHGKVEALRFYFEGVDQALKQLGPEAAISVQTFVNYTTPSKEIVQQAEAIYERFEPRVRIKIPAIKNGFKAAEELIKKDIPLNMTLIFSQEQERLTILSTRNAKQEIFHSVFFRREMLNGKANPQILMEKCLDLLSLPENRDSPITLLLASTKTAGDLQYATAIGVPYVTAPLVAIKDWEKTNFSTPPGYRIDLPEDCRDCLYDSLLKEKGERTDDQNPLAKAGIKSFRKDFEKMCFPSRGYPSLDEIKIALFT